MRVTMQQQTRTTIFLMLISKIWATKKIN
jgi:hypothetical protein